MQRLIANKLLTDSEMRNQYKAEKNQDNCQRIAEELLSKGTVELKVTYVSKSQDRVVIPAF